MPFWRKSEKSDARRDAQPHFLLVKNIIWDLGHFWAFLVIFAIFGKKISQNPILWDFLLKNTPKYDFIKIFGQNTSQNTIL